MNRYIKVLVLLFLSNSVMAALPISQQPHSSGPMTVFLGGFELTDVMDASIDLTDLQSKYLKFVGLPESELSGQAVLVYRALGSIMAEANQDDFPIHAPDNTHEECIDAYYDKWRWHRDNGGVPPAFGKITNYRLAEDAQRGAWTGNVDVCTWLGATNYYFQIQFVDAGEQSMSLSAPFDSPLDIYPPMAADIRNSGYKYKLHARNDAIRYISVHENGVELPDGHPFFRDNTQNCFDTFYVNRPTGKKGHDLAEQLGYCMGRCDGKIMNTGK